MEDPQLSQRLKIVKLKVGQLRAGFEVLFPGVMEIQDTLIVEQISFRKLIGEIEAHVPFLSSSSSSSSVSTKLYFSMKYGLKYNYWFYFHVF
jgi:hypothetical protein